MSKKILLCADDFGLSPAVCSGIIELAQKKRLSAVSCLVNMPSFEAYADQLLVAADKVQLGLHLNLTEGFLLSEQRPCFRFAALALKAHARLLPVTLIKQELEAQLERFVNITGRWPDFIDGHQHIHQFPVLRSLLIALYNECLRAHQVSIRSTWPLIQAHHYDIKAFLLARSGAKALQRLLIRHAIPHNHSFSGMYTFSSASDYRTLFVQWLKKASSNTLIMCHPGGDPKDDCAHAALRFKEFSYLSSDALLQDCAKYHVIL